MDSTTLNPQQKKKGFGLSVSFISTMFMILYMSTSMFHLYRLMFPLSMIDLSKFQYPRDFIHPLWKTNIEATKSDMHMRVYLSTSQIFSLQFLAANATKTTSQHVLLWDQKLDSPSLSKNFLLTNFVDGTDEECITDASYQFAVDWINRTEKMHLLAESDGDILSKLSAASGQGVESTSFLIMFYQTISKRLQYVLMYLSGMEAKPDDDVQKASTSTSSSENHVNIFIPPTSAVWMAIRSNSTLYLHVLVLNTGMGKDVIEWPPTSIENAELSIRKLSNTNALLSGKVNMIKYDLPSHINQPRRVLYRDLLYFWNRYIMASREMPPWEMSFYKPEEYIAYQRSKNWKQQRMGYPYWKPEVSIKFVSDDDSYPIDYAHTCGMPLVQVRGSGSKQHHPTGHAFTPALHVDEMGMTSEKYIPVNETVTSLPLRISFDRNDMEQRRIVATATAGGISPARWRLLSHLSKAIEQQKELGFDDSDIDEIKRLIADTNITLLTITMLASALHLLFEFLTFKSEVSFWNKNKDLTGLSVRSLFLDMIGQIIILFYLIEQQSSLLTTVPCGIGCLIALWKCERAAGLRFVKTNKNSTATWYNWLPRTVTGYELRATRLDAQSQPESEEKDATRDNNKKAKDRLIAMTIESDRMATKYLGAVLLPVAWSYAIYSLIYKEHNSWYSWMITSLASTVYALGFVLMTPQLFLNYKLKSVAHLPWRVLVYKSLNTFIDDLFSFIIRMPTMARISCFRDDVVFFIYLYQRWLYPVDALRPVEGGGEHEPLIEDQVQAPSKLRNNNVQKKKDQ
jgi:Cleft lip and palate transmembrane protein 1 (CLPTM1)